MARACTVCTCPEREAIDAALVAGEPNRRIAARYGLAEASIRRHKAQHLPEALVRAGTALQTATAADLLEQVQALQQRTVAILERAERAGDLRTALQAIRECRGCLELHARMVAAALELERKREEEPMIPVREIVVELPRILDEEIERLEAELARRGEH